MPRKPPPSEFLFFVDDGEQWFDVRRCEVCGEMLDLMDQALHGEVHPDHEGDVEREQTA